MKTSEFKQKVEELGYPISHDNESATLRIKSHGELIVTVNIKRIMCLSTRFGFANTLNDSDMLELAELLFEYASTPLDEREEERKWYIKCPITGQFLNINENGKIMWNNYKYDSAGWQSEYTRAEIEAFTFEHAHLIEDEVSE
ncbi:hypothetical protein [Listeria rocourtiae]|uniref:hypothetical protein n=1 Tax=Listeria rocourtiae TaxID=647910 RepID=UPI003D2F5D41